MPMFFRARCMRPPVAPTQGAPQSRVSWTWIPRMRDAWSVQHSRSRRLRLSGFDALHATTTACADRICTFSSSGAGPCSPTSQGSWPAEIWPSLYVPSAIMPRMESCEWIGKPLCVRSIAAQRPTARADLGRHCGAKGGRVATTHPANQAAQ